jgi:hypothetical protein
MKELRKASIARLTTRNFWEMTIFILLFPFEDKNSVASARTLLHILIILISSTNFCSTTTLRFLGFFLLILVRLAISLLACNTSSLLFATASARKDADADISNILFLGAFCFTIPVECDWLFPNDLSLKAPVSMQSFLAADPRSDIAYSSMSSLMLFS